MIAIVASALLGLYVFLPAFLFNKLAFNFRAVTRTPKGRFEEIISAAAVALLPFLAAALFSKISWWVGHWPFPVQEDLAAKHSDYKTLISALASDSYFHAHWDATWIAVSCARLNQSRFLFWMYIALGIEILSVYLLTYFYGSLNQYPLYRWSFRRVFLGRASQWEVLLTGFAFPPGSRPQIEVDALTTDDHLYAGTVADYFLKADGELSGLLLQGIRRYRRDRLDDDRKTGTQSDVGDYWKDIPGAKFYLPADKIANLNIRYETASGELIEDRDLIQDVDEVVRSLNLGIPFTVRLGWDNDSEAQHADPSDDD
jgi:hypothetical protein